MSDKLFKVPADWAKNSYVNQSSYEAKYKESINNNEKSIKNLNYLQGYGP